MIEKMMKTSPPLQMNQVWQNLKVENEKANKLLIYIPKDRIT